MKTKIPTKKAQLEVQFNWIFIFIVGTIILLFFFAVGKSYMHNSDIKLAGKVMYDLDSIMKGATSSTKSALMVEIPKLELGFTCFPDCSDEGCSSDFSIADTGANKPTPFNVVFSPAKIESDYLITWSLDWNIPFKVTNFLYLTSPDIKYVLVYKEQLPESKAIADKIYALFQDNEFINVELKEEQDLSEMQDEGNKNVRFVFFYKFGNSQDDAPKINEDVINADFDVVIAEPFTDTSFEGNLVFLSKDEVLGGFQYSMLKRYGYYGKEALVGAIFSENAEFYECNMKKAFSHYNRILDAYKRRAGYLSFYVTDNPKFQHCSAVYEELVTMQSKPIEYVGLFDAQSLYAIKNVAQVAESINQNTILSSCPRLY